MIPKVIHYCWFGRGKKPYLIRQCIKTWRKNLPDFEFREWNESNFDVNVCKFVSDAYKEKKWAFVADYCRFYALYNFGGIYLDTDIKVYRDLSPFLHHEFFAGTEVRTAEKTDDFVTVDASTFGCEKGHWFTKMCLDFYKDKPFRLADGSIPGGVVQVVATRILEKYGYQRKNEDQKIKDVQIYSTQYFANVTTQNRGKQLYTLHYFDGSWISDPKRGKVYNYCREHDLMHYYRFVERAMSIFR